MSFIIDIHQTIANIGKHSDVELILMDDSGQIIKLNLHKNILSWKCEYFDKMFSFNPNKNSYELFVPNATIMKQVLLSFYGIKIDPQQFPLWQLVLETIRCKNYLCIDINVRSVYNLKIPEEGFNLLLDIVSTNDLKKRQDLIYLVKKNLPADIDSELIKQIFGDENNLNKLLKCNCLDIRVSNTRDCIKVYDFTSLQLVNMLMVNSDNESIPYLNEKLSNDDTYHEIIQPRKAKISLDCTKIIAFYADNKLRVWDAQKGNIINTIEITRHTLFSFSPDCQKIALITNRILSIHDADTNFCKEEPVYLSDWVSCLDFSQNGEKIVFVTDITSINILEISTNKITKIFDINTNFRPDLRNIARVLFYHHDKIFLCSAERDVFVFNIIDDTIVKISEYYGNYMVPVTNTRYILFKYIDDTQIYNGTDNICSINSSMNIVKLKYILTNGKNSLELLEKEHYDKDKIESIKDIMAELKIW